MRPHRERSGFILLATLAVLALASLAMLALCRTSIARASDARAAEDDLRQRWACLSIERSLLPRAESILAVAETDSNEPLVSVGTTIHLNGQSVDLVFGDESAKANLNALLERGRENALQTARSLLSGSGVAGHLEIHPERLLNHRVGALGEVFMAPIGPEDLIAGANPAVERITCWGEGKINVYRASEEALQAVLSPSLSLTQITKLRALTKERPTPSVTSMLSQLELTAQQRAFAEKAIASGSSCHSLWSVLDTGRHKLYYLSVRDDVAPANEGTISFQW